MTRTLLLLSAAATLAAGQQIVQFKDHVIENNERGGYAVIVTDVNHDGKPDVIGVSQQVNHLSWYENPTWTQHIMLSEAPALVNLAAYDIDGDGVPEIAIETGFAMQQKKSPGDVWLVAHQGDPREPWKEYKVDQYATAHHIAWADIDGSGHKALIMAPLVGPTNSAPTYAGKTPLFWYRVPKDWSGPWKRELVDDDINGIVHRVRVVQWNTKGKKEQLMVAGFDGVTLYTAMGKGEHIKWDKKSIVKGHDSEPAPRLGTSDMKIAHLGKKRFLAAVEPWHGNEVVVYTDNGKGGWNRHVIYDKLAEGHEVCVGDFNGDGRDEIVAGDRAHGKVATSHIFYATDDTGTQWRHEELDHLGMSASGCQVADINGDGRPDIVMIGGATHNIKWYENMGVEKTSNSGQ
ncbi:MAG TPA: VCBS repeat-containing protein [Bryobacteraceae bacterium]|nr:VCBS repeat-containing protein [Bryobacteraceae bacterium]